MCDRSAVGAVGGDRTRALPLRRRTLYPLSYYGDPLIVSVRGLGSFPTVLSQIGTPVVARLRYRLALLVGAGIRVRADVRDIALAPSASYVTASDVANVSARTRPTGVRAVRTMTAPRCGCPVAAVAAAPGDHLSRLDGDDHRLHCSFWVHESASESAWALLPPSPPCERRVRVHARPSAYDGS